MASVERDLYSVWALLDGEAAAQLQQVRDGISAYGISDFPLHVPLLKRSELHMLGYSRRELLSRIQHVAAGSPPSLDYTIGRPSYGNGNEMFIFYSLVEDEMLRRLRAELLDALKWPGAGGFRPDASILHGGAMPQLKNSLTRSLPNITEQGLIWELALVMNREAYNQSSGEITSELEIVDTVPLGIKHDNQVA